MSEASCWCPTSGLGYRFHRHPCQRAGEIEDMAPAAKGCGGDEEERA